MKTTIAALALMLSACGGGSGQMNQSGAPVAQAAPQPVATPQAPPAAAPITVIYVGTSAADTLAAGDTCCSDVIEAYKETGFVVEAIDAPCHGADTPMCEASGLEGWALEIKAGRREWLERFCQRLDAVIDGRSVFLAGTSRGAYAILACNVGAPVLGIIGNAALIDLYQLTEFADVPRDATYSLLPQRVPTMIRIARNDERVGTQPAIDYAMQSGAELVVLDIDAHIAPEDGTGIEFIRRHLSF